MPRTLIFTSTSERANARSIVSLISAAYGSNLPESSTAHIVRRRANSTCVALVRVACRVIHTSGRFETTIQKTLIASSCFLVLRAHMTQGRDKKERTRIVATNRTLRVLCLCALFGFSTR